MAIVIAAVIGAVLFGCYYMFKVSEEDNSLYCSSGQIYVDSNNMIESCDVDSNKLNNFTDIYSSFIKSDIVLSDVIERLGPEHQLSIEELRKSIVVIAISEEIIEINVFMKTPEMADNVSSAVIYSTNTFFLKEIVKQKS